MIKEAFLREIEAFLAASGMSHTAFGKAVMKDASFVTRLRGKDGKLGNVTADTIESVQQWMRENQHLTTRMSA